MWANIETDKENPVILIISSRIPEKRDKGMMERK
jgi:hypothetical protein